MSSESLSFRKFTARTPDAEREIEVAHDGEAFRVRSGKSEADVTWTELECGRSLITVDGRPLEVRVHTTPDGFVHLEWSGHWFSFRLEDDLAARARTAHSQAAGPFPFRSPMPGMVLQVLVGDGDVVSQEQPLLILEAMKMQNELAAPVAGTVEGLAVQAGQAVEGDQILLRIRP